VQSVYMGSRGRLVARGAISTSNVNL
jgi:hypothetical protein